jgi:hypothetical protein
MWYKLIAIIVASDLIKNTALVLLQFQNTVSENITTYLMTKRKYKTQMLAFLYLQVFILFNYLACMCIFKLFLIILGKQ